MYPFAILRSINLVFIITLLYPLLFIQIDRVHQALCVDVDGEGTIPASLRNILSKWTPADAKNPE